ncbi:MAG TPA: hypothetical protein VF608_08575, partial [Thermoanaerobaculia bacterium]
GHQNYYLWGPRDATGESVIIITDEVDPTRWKSIEIVGKRYHPYAMPEENAPIFHGRGFKKPLGDVWKSVKNWR